ncbi:MAG: DHH family phosphoesterase, partial [Sciscionella sp.]|nr:DHH family phosphoesterase [Sciscionella sp.]
MGSAAAGADVGFAAAAKLLAGARDAVLLGHVSPDADALGSALALGLALRRRGCAVAVSVGAPDEMPESLRHLDSANLYVQASRLIDRAPAKLIIALDTGSIDRLGPLAALATATAKAGGTVLVVDHHLSNTRFGTHNLVDPAADATASIVAGLLDELGEPIDEPIARCLYAGLATDTSHFVRATGDTHRLAARLVD